MVSGGYMDSIINVNKLTFRYDDNFIFDKLSFSVGKGEWVSITGPNGSGKSTLIKILTGLIDTTNDITICNLLLNEQNLYSIRKNIGIVFDNPDNFFLCETVEDDLAFTLENLCYSPKDIKSRINEISDMMNIRHLLHKSPNELSGGEKCKVAIAIALIHKPRILILDEALGMIDENEKNSILEILHSFNKKGLTIINVVHDLRETYFADRLIVINDGEIMIEGSPLKVMEKDKILNRLGICLPFEIELSIKLKLYGLIDTLIPDVEKLVNTLW